MLGLDRLCDFVPRVSRASVLWIGLERGAQLRFGGSFSVHDGFVEQSGLIAGDRLLRILQPENVLLRDPCILFRLLAEILQQRDSPCVKLQSIRILHVPQEIELRHSQHAPRVAGMSRDEDQIALFYSHGRPLQIVLEMSRLSVFVDPEECDVQIVAGIGEVVRIASEKGDIELRRKHQSHVRVLFVFVQVVNLPGIKSDDVTAQSGRGRAVFLDLRHGGPLSLSEFCRRHVRLHACIHLVRDILNPYQFVQLQVRALGFFGLGFGVKAGLDVVVSLAGKLLDTSRSDVVVGDVRPSGETNDPETAVLSNRTDDSRT